MWLHFLCDICEIFLFRTLSIKHLLNICYIVPRGYRKSLDYFSLFISSSLKMFNMQFQSNTLMLEVVWNISAKNCTSTFNPDFQNGETEMVTQLYKVWIRCVVKWWFREKWRSFIVKGTLALHLSVRMWKWQIFCFVMGGSTNTGIYYIALWET